MKKVLFYSQDSEGADHIRRTVSICQFLLAAIPGLFIKIITGSPTINRLHVPEGIDYVQLPSWEDGAPATVDAHDGDLHQVFKGRADTILSQVVNFQPDLIVVDGTPFGVQHELLPVLEYRQEQLPETKLVLLLQDVVDRASFIKDSWKKLGYFEALERHYHRIWVLGSPRVFDAREEYGLSPAISAKTRFLGYMRRPSGLKRAEVVRRALGIGMKDPVAVFSTGGARADVRFIEGYLEALSQVPGELGFTSVILMDREMSAGNQERLQEWAQSLRQVKTILVDDDEMSFLEAADLVVARGGYQSMCEILTLNKAAIVIPSVDLIEDQSIRVSRIAKLGLLTMIHPTEYTAWGLIRAIQQELRMPRRATREAFPLSVDALPKLSQEVAGLLQLATTDLLPPFPSDEPGVFKDRALHQTMRRFFSILL